MLTFDTSNATEDKQVKIDGTVYTISPLGSASFMKLMSKRDLLDKISAGKLTAEQMVNAQDQVFDIIRPLITPADKFQKWEDGIRDRNAMAYWQVMGRLLSLVTEDMNAKVSD